MNRRDLLKAVAPLTLAGVVPLVVRGKEVGKSIEIDPQSKYMVFVDGRMIDAEVLARDPNCPLPMGTPIYPVHVMSGTSIEDAIRIFKLI